MLHIRARLNRFRTSDEGSISVEAMLILPILIWCYVGTFVFFDAYRAQSINVKAGYTIADTLSRETGYVTNAYLDSLFELQQFLVDTIEPVGLRITVFDFDEDDDAYEVRWSRARGTMAPINNAGLAALRGQLPVMPDGEVAIIVQSEVGYRPRYNVGLADITFEDLTVIRPRSAGQLCWNSVEGGDQTTATC